MELKDNYFLAIYTNEVKDYATTKFFTALSDFRIGGVVDNSTRKDYYYKLETLTTLPVYHLDIPHLPDMNRFHRKIETSVNFLRDKFLQTTCKYFLIIESDVIAPANFIEKLDEDIKTLPEDWGAIGALYYPGFHDYTKTGIQRTQHVLSGLTVYRREAVERIKFRWDPNWLPGFPDQWWSEDARKDWSLWDDHDLKCEHLHHKDGSRYSSPL